MNPYFKRLLSIILAATLMLSACALTVNAAETGGDETPAIADVGVEYGYVPVGEPSTEATEPTKPQQPTITLSFNNTAEGTQISWDAVEGAARYVLFLHAQEGYQMLAETDATEYLHTPLEDGAVYSYNIRALDAKGDTMIDLAASDSVNTFIAPPVIDSLSGNAEGVELTWNETAASRYRVYRRVTASEWSRVGETNGTIYLDTTAESGKTYIYTVRCISEDGERFLSYHNSGKSLFFVRTPSITSISNTATGARINWDKPDGAYRCRVYVKDGSDWRRLTETADTSYEHENLADGRIYTYTVRCVDKNGDFVSEFNRDGWENTFIAPPVITSLTNTKEGIEIRWSKRSAAEKYRVYYYGSKGWTRLAETEDTVLLDTDVESGYHYTYTVRCISADSEHFMSYHNSGKRTLFVGEPVISSITNTETGAKISRTKPDGAEYCRVYVRDSSGWNRLTETGGSSYVHENLKSSQSYTYTIRCVDDDGEFTTGFNSDGWENTFIEPPVITSMTNTETGVEIRWSKPAGAEKFRIYYYGSKGWTRMADLTDTVYLDEDVESGYHYTYTVRCISADGNSFTSDYKSGKKTQYIGVPKITSFSNTETGTTIYWKKPDGAYKCRVYVKAGSDWKRLAETADSSYTYDDLTNNTAYTYTVRCVDGDGDFVSDFDGKGWTYTFIKPPAIDSVSRVNNANLVKWNSIAGASAYRPYRKGFNGSWSRIADRVEGTSYSDTTAKADTLYAYTVRCLDADGELISDYYGSSTYYYNGKLAQGGINVNGNTLYFDKGRIRSGYQTIDGKTYYYGPDGQIRKNGIVGNSSDGYCYADKNGVIDFSYRGAVTSNGVDWIVEDGKAYKVSDSDDRTLFRAMKLVAKVTNSSMSKSQKLRACFDYLQNNDDYIEMNPRIPDYTGMDWMIVYANDIFVDERGNCLSYAAAFAYMAKAIGYKNVYGCNSGGHGWAEIEGRIYDPEWGMHRFNYSYYGMSYDEPCDVAYAAGIAAGKPFMHIKIS